MGWILWTRTRPEDGRSRRREPRSFCSAFNPVLLLVLFVAASIGSTGFGRVILLLRLKSGLAAFFFCVRVGFIGRGGGGRRGGLQVCECLASFFLSIDLT
ncbi:hypothetical protein BZA05DRAFT_26782 [Tricharina praecox]|uniref:uncharacterized protein n=1 Tax=Tricharina praecox TaxID=43433 RepID=UPI00221EA3A8|nr:uncharacterized protein BZA05DRAFT_26782 [Tricharina praecox]KAI5853362.1 hypothetical protein BZA05DRAFT_26782 [Tricharina praecox]